MSTVPEPARQIILAHKGSPTKAQQACMAAGYRLTRRAVRYVLEKAVESEVTQPDDACQVTHLMATCWRINYGLDKRSPADAARWWDAQWEGKAPAGAVAALGHALNNIDRLRLALRTIKASAGNPEFVFHTARDVLAEFEAPEDQPKEPK